MRASGVMPSSFGPGVAHHHHRRGAVVERAGVAGGDLAVGPEHRLEGGEPLERDTGTRTVVLVGHGAVGQRDRRDLVGEEAVLDVGHGAVLGELGELVHLRA